MTLYEIDAAMYELIDPETGELRDYEAFAALNMAREAKIENTACWYKDMIGDAEKLGKEIETLRERKRTLEARAARMKEYLSLTLCGEKFTSSRCNISFRKSSSLEVPDPYAAAKWLEENGFDDMVSYSEPTIAKTEVRKLTAQGLDVPGVELKDKISAIIK